MDLSNVYIVVAEGEVQYATQDASSANNFAESKNYEGIQSILDNWDNEYSISRAKERFYGDYYKVENVNLSGKNYDDEVRLSSGMEIDVSEILEYIEI